MSEPTIIDTKMHGFDEITAAFILRGRGQVALVETGPKSSVDHLLQGLEREGIERLDWIIVTHIHLDHAGSAGTLARRFPEAMIAVHPVGAPHLVDPSKLWLSARRIYGDAMEELWGGIDPLDRDRVKIIEDGDRIDIGGRTLIAIETLGHAGHHHAYLDDATGYVFTGDALGIGLPGIDGIRPATPPPEFNLEMAIESIRKLREVGPSALWLTHFGPIGTDVDEACAEAADVLNRWAEWVKRARASSRDLDDVTAAVREEARRDLENRLSEEEAARMEMTTSYRMNVGGYMRYFDKKEKAIGS